MKLGLGFLFGAKDRGAGKALGRTRRSVSDIGAEMDKATEKSGDLRSSVESAGKSMTRTFEQSAASTRRLTASIGAFTIHGLNQIEDTLQNMASGGGGAGQLTTSIQNQATQFDKSFAGMSARVGLFGKDMRAVEREVFQTAYALNADANKAGEAFLELKKKGLTYEDLGLDNMEQYIKFLEGSGMEASALTQTVQSLRKSYGYSTKQSGEFMDMLIQQSTALGIGTEAVGQLTGMLDSMDTAFTQTLAKEGPEAVDKATRSILQLAGAMMKATGADPQKAMEQSIGLFSKLQEEARALPQMAAGMDKDFGDLVQGLSVDLPGGFQQAFSGVQEDPLKFAATMDTVFSDLRKQSEGGSARAGAALQRLQGVLEPLGTDFLFTVDNAGELSKTLNDSQFAKGGIDSMRAFAQESYRTGLTLDDQVERIAETFKTRLRGMIGKDLKGFVASQKKIYTQTGNALKILLTGVDTSKPRAQLSALEKVALKLNENGLGPVARKLIVIGTVGPAALGPLLDLAQQFMPIVLILSALGLKLGSVGKLFGAFKYLLTPITAVGSALAALLGPELAVVLGAIVLVTGAVLLLSAAINGQLGPTMEKFAGTVQTGITQALRFGAKFLSGLAHTFETMDPKMVAGKIADFFGKVIDFVLGKGENPFATPEMEKWGGLFWAALKASVVAAGALSKGIFSALMERLKKAVHEMSWGDLVKVAVVGISGLFGGPAAGALTAGLIRVLSEINWKSIGTSMLDFAKSHMAWIAGGLAGLIFGPLGGVIAGAGVYLVEAFRKDGLKGVNQALVDGLTKALDIGTFISDSYNKLQDKILAVLTGTDWAGLIDRGLGKIDEWRLIFARKALAMVEGLTKTLSEIDWEKEIPKFVDGMVKSITEFFSGPVDPKLGAAGGALASSLAEGAGKSDQITGAMKSIVGRVFGSLVKFATSPEAKAASSALWSALGQLLMAGSKALSAVMIEIGKSAVRVMFDTIFGEGSFLKVQETISKVLGFFNALWKGIYDGAYALFGNSLHTLISGDLGQVFGFLEQVKDWFEGLWLSVVGMYSGIGDVLTGVWTTVYDSVASMWNNLVSLFWEKIDLIKRVFGGVSQVLGPVITKLMGETSARVAVTTEQQAAASSSNAYQKLMERRDAESLGEVLRAEFAATRLVLEEIKARIVPGVPLSAPTRRRVPGSSEGLAPSNG